MGLIEDSTTNVNIRHSRPQDYEAVTEIWSACGLQARTRGRDSKGSFVHQLETYGDFYFVAAADERVVGVVFGTHDGRKGWINRLAVLPEYQRRGIASALVQRCEQALRQSGIGIVAALVESDNETSAALFWKLGYRDDVPVRYFRKLDDPDV